MLTASYNHLPSAGVTAGLYLLDHDGVGHGFVSLLGLQVSRYLHYLQYLQYLDGQATLLLAASSHPLTRAEKVRVSREPVTVLPSAENVYGGRTPRHLPRSAAGSPRRQSRPRSSAVGACTEIFLTHLF